MSTTLFWIFTLFPLTPTTTAMSSVARALGTSSLARQIPFTDAWQPSSHSRFCALIYATQNGWKLPILFEELGVPYDWCLVDFAKQEQKSPAFLRINPNGRIPALIDRQANVTVAESGAILEYICEVTPEGARLWPRRDDDWQRHWLCKQWLYWQVSGQGPMLGQSMYFNRLAAVQGNRDDFAIRRFGNEAKRCLQIMNDQLQESGGPFLLGADISVVDVACFAYAASAYWACVDITGMPQLQAWLAMLHERLSFKTGLTIPFARPAFFGPPYATAAEIEAEIAGNSAQFDTTQKK